MNLFTSVILGIVEGVTEFLPISSTGHLILTSSLSQIDQSEFLKSFEIAIQLGAILSVVVLYWKSFIFEREKLGKVIAAFIPTAIMGLIFYKVMKVYLLGNQGIVLWALFIGGILIIVLEYFYSKKKRNIKEISSVTYKQAVLIGLFQSVAMVPGVSRSAATIMGGLMLGINRKTIVEFSFLLAIPTMAAAVGYDLIKTAVSFTKEQFVYLFIGFIVSFLTAMIAVKFLLSFIRKNNFIPFGIYRIILSILLWYLLYIKRI
ncbi:MAG: undecaprenyl-diphosphate phosphatase [Candidatus Ratteibacteria bacterium]|nr:undecaprenyl-diphosphate phosphatase [Candidatus Ratteibacteria bacterium]